MHTVDAQLHDIAPNLDWSGYGLPTRHDILTELVLAYLDSVGVSGAILVPGDKEWAAAAAKQQPDRLAYITHITPEIADIDAYVADAKAKRSENLLALRATISFPLDGSRVRQLEEGK